MGLLTVSIVGAIATVPVRTVLLPTATATSLAITATPVGSGVRFIVTLSLDTVVILGEKIYVVHDSTSYAPWCERDKLTCHGTICIML